MKSKFDAPKALNEVQKAAVQEPQTVSPSLTIQKEVKVEILTERPSEEIKIDEAQDKEVFFEFGF